ncbi:MAG TPA: carbohydrate ABC transporter permease [Clostridiales bacterium]|nr:carbohydrate ABC transporter permease [Clostridiales bacterium]
MLKKISWFQAFANIILLLLAASCILPFLLLVSSSFSSENALIRYGYNFFPKEFSLDAYRYILQKSEVIFNAYGITFLVTAAGVSLSLLITILLAYPLSRRELRFKRLLSFYVMLTMLFNGGLVPYYIMWTRGFGIKNTIWALLLPNLLLNAFSVMMARSFFLSSIPEEVIEAARIDGASEYRILYKIVAPMSKPIIATLGLMSVLGYWNDWTNGLYFITNTKLYSVQQLLNQMLLNVQFLATVSKVGQAGVAGMQMPSVGIRMAIAVLGVIPIMIAYPFFQNYFVKGITIGAVKG